MSELDYLELHRLILEILTPERFIWVEDEDGVEHHIKFIYPDNSTRLRAMLLETKCFEQAKANGLFAEDDMPEEFVERFFSVEDSDRVHELESKIKGYELLLRKRVKGTEKYESDKKTISDLKLEQENLLSKKNLIREFSAEAYSREEAQYYLLSQCCFDAIKGNQLWLNQDQMLEQCKPSFLYSLMSEFLSFYWGPSIKVIRKIARSGQWRNLYIASTKTGMQLFNGSAQDITIPQMQLLSWSMQYQSIYEMPYEDRPSDEVIEDDERFDQFIEDYHKKIKAETAKSSMKASKKLKEESQHTIVAAGAEDYVKLHKSEAYSDTSLITGRSSEQSTVYDEVKEAKQVRRKVKKLNSKKPSNRLKRGGK